MGREIYLRPSSAGTWIVCAGYAAMCAAYPHSIDDEVDTEIREDGLACHWLANEQWIGNEHAEGSSAYNQRIITEEMLDAVDQYIDVIFKWTKDSALIQIEKPIACKIISDTQQGTPDAWYYDYATRTLYIADLKFGFRFVEVWENWQLIIYALSILDLLGINGIEDQTIRVVFTIVQPRDFSPRGQVRLWEVKASDLRPYANIIRDAVAKANLENPLCTPNPGCDTCPARHACVTHQQAALSAIERSFDSLPHELTPAAAGKALSIVKESIKRLEAMETGLTAQMESIIRSGQVIVGWEVAPTFSKLAWKPESQNDILTLQKYFPDAQLQKPRVPISPTQAKKVLPESIVAMYSHKPQSGVRLVKTDKFAAKKKFLTGALK